MNQLQMLFISVCIFTMHVNAATRIPLQRISTGKEIPLGRPDPDPVILPESHFVTVMSVGTPPQEFSMKLDLTSAIAWVPSSKCFKRDPMCGLHRLYDSAASSTFVENGTELNDFYHFEKLQGFISQDTVTLAGLSVSGQQFGEILTHPAVPYFERDFDGSLGLGYPALSETTPLFDSLMANHLLPQNIFSFVYHSDREAKEGGVLLLGAIDESYFTGELHYVSVSHKLYWQIPMDAVFLDDDLVICETGCQVAMFSGLLSSGPEDEILALHTAIGATPVDNELYKVECDTIPNLPEISFFLGGKNFSLSAEDYILDLYNNLCLSTFISNKQPNSQGPLWFLGEMFLRRYYTVFDRDADRLGFAPVKLSATAPGY